MIDLTAYRNDSAIIRDTAFQINKDFSTFGFEISFSGKDQFAYDELKNQLVPVIADLIRHNEEKLRAILYRIDVIESKINSAFSGNDMNGAAQAIADLIIERELQKILTRRLFS